MTNTPPMSPGKDMNQVQAYCWQEVLRENFTIGAKGEVLRIENDKLKEDIMRLSQRNNELYAKVCQLTRHIQNLKPTPTPRPMPRLNNNYARPPEVIIRKEKPKRRSGHSVPVVITGNTLPQDARLPYKKRIRSK